MKVYVDDILVKFLLPANLVPNLEDTISTIQRYGMKLNPQKYIFGVGGLIFWIYDDQARN